MVLRVSAEIPKMILTRDQLKIFIKHWPLRLEQSPRGVVCIIHGLGEHIGRYEQVAQFLSRAGWIVVGYDQRGHGRSDGIRGAIKHNDDLLCDLAEVIDIIKLAFPTLRLAILGHSLGGLVAARYAAALAEPCENVVWRRSIDLCLLSSPALELPLTGFQLLLLNTLGRLTPNLQVSNGLNPDWLSTDQSVVTDYRKDPLVHDRVTGRLSRFILESAQIIQARASQWRVKTLLIYSGLDRCVSPSGSRRFAASVPLDWLDSKEYPSFRHEIFNERESDSVLNDLQDWLQKQ